MTDQREELLCDLLLRWEEDYRLGHDVPAIELARDHPELIEELARRIKVLVELAWLDKPLLAASPNGASGLPAAVVQEILASGYRLDDVIAAGGFAEVYRAYNIQLQRTVAIKIPKASGLVSRETFLAEARRVARLAHDNILPVHDASFEGETCFIVMEYVPGGSLAGRLGKGRVSQRDMFRWIIEIAGALEYAHLQGIIHLDVKPANILIKASGRAVLADFGIARLATKTGQLTPSLGTLRYMSPEQLTGREPDPRSDVYSLAVVLHEGLTGELPYSSPEKAVLEEEILGGRASPSGNLPRGIRNVLIKALSASPHDRHVSAAHFASDVTRAGAEPYALLRSRWAIGGGAILTVAIVVAAILVGRGSGVSNTPVSPPVTPIPDQVSHTGENQPSFRDLVGVATTDMHHGRLESAEAGFTKALELSPGNVEVLRSRGACRFLAKRYEDAVKDFTAALAVDSDHLQTLRTRAQAYGLLRDFPSAIADLERVITLAPTADWAHSDLATVYGVRSHERFGQKDYAGSKADMDEAIRHAPDSAINYKRRAAGHFAMGDYAAAANDMDEAIRREPSNHEYFTSRALALRKLGRDAEAEADEERASELRQK